MVNRLDLRGRTLSARELADVLPRAEVDVDAASALVAPVLDDVRTRGAAALRDLSERFDGVRPQRLRVPREALDAALADLHFAVRAALEETITRVRAVHAAQVPQPFTVDLGPGARVRQRWVPVGRVASQIQSSAA